MIIELGQLQSKSKTDETSREGGGGWGVGKSLYYIEEDDC